MSHSSSSSSSSSSPSSALSEHDAATSPSVPPTTTTLNKAPGVTLTPQQESVMKSVLSLFAGQASKDNLACWTDDAVFEDPLTMARGRAQYEAQWYGLSSAFGEIRVLGHEVCKGGNSMEMRLRNSYKLKGLGKETVVESRVVVWTREEGEEKGLGGPQGGHGGEGKGRGLLRIEKVQDKWDGKLPEGSVANVSSWDFLYFYNAFSRQVIAAESSGLDAIRSGMVWFVC
ncbi:hypothetical protein MKZ38_003875 [Zalerion maritima]|uniref:SnoaL-like domain-containing protein n=1 Tax=Zalerion maritima TaxID=339359 RepID=A0AAD5RTM7_9PEZI|nr:hypothetical protein MKZ38_003875 [Zalerion maritima]